MKTIFIKVDDELYEDIKKDCDNFDCEAGDVISAYVEIANRRISFMNDESPPDGELMFRGQLITSIKRRRAKFESGEEDEEQENRN